MLTKELYKSLTWDRGKEVSNHQRFTLATDIEGLFLRSSESMATWIEREYERPAEAIHPERD